MPLINAFTGVQLRQIVWAMLGAVILVLLIACVNVMNMQFGRAALRAKELAIRGALGATRWRLVRQMLTESLVVAVFGAIAGSLLAYWGVDMFDKVVKAAPFPPPYWWQFTIDGRVLVFTLAITLVATIVSGLLPAFLSSRGNAAEMMKEGGRGNSSRLVNVITRVLVVGQIALTAALLIAATLQIKSIRNQTKLDYGYDENGLYAARLALMEGTYPSEDSRREFFTRAVRALRTNPQFEAAAMTDRFRMTFAPAGQYEVDGQKLSDRSRSSALQFRIRLRRLLHHPRPQDSRRPRFHHRRHRLEAAGRDRERELRAQVLGQPERARTSGAHLQSRQRTAVAHHRRRRARHVDAGAVRSADRGRRLLHAAARRVARHAVCHRSR